MCRKLACQTANSEAGYGDFSNSLTTFPKWILTSNNADVK